MSNTKTSEGLKRVIGVSGLSLNIINNTVGAGIFVLPAIVAISLGGFLFSATSHASGRCVSINPLFL